MRNFFLIMFLAITITSFAQESNNLDPILLKYDSFVWKSEAPKGERAEHYRKSPRKPIQNGIPKNGIAHEII